MQQAQQRANGSGVPAQTERISWARSMIFAAGFFFLAALLIGQIPGYINLAMTASSLVGFEQGIACPGGRVPGRIYCYSDSRHAF